jgi:hypothetical protein
VEEYYKEMELTMMRLKLEEKQEQTLPCFFNGLNFPIKRIVEFLPYTTLWDLVHKATRAECQLQDDAKHEHTKGFFASRNSSASTPPTHKPSFASSSKPFSKPPQPTTQVHAPTTTTSSKASSAPPKVTCFKCGVQGHKSFECKNTRVMITKDNGTIATMMKTSMKLLSKRPSPWKRMTWVMKRNMCYALMTLAHPLSSQRF